MNITLDLSKGQLSKLRNGHGIRISPAMVGNGVDIIVDPMTYHNMSEKLDHSLEANILKTMNDSFSQVSFNNKSFRNRFKSLTL